MLETSGINEADLVKYCLERGLYPKKIATWRAACCVLRAACCVLRAERQIAGATRMQHVLGICERNRKMRVKALGWALVNKVRTLSETALRLVLQKRAQHCGEGRACIQITQIANCRK